MQFAFHPYVAVQVNDYQRAVRFYVDVMGMELVRQDENEAELRNGEMTFFIENKPGGSIFFEFKVEDLEAARQSLEQAGCQISPTHTEEGNPSFIARDPYGMLFHFFAD